MHGESTGFRRSLPRSPSSSSGRPFSLSPNWAVHPHPDITAIHIPVAGLALVPLLLGLPPMLFPMHLVLPELLIDPLCSIVI